MALKTWRYNNEVLDKKDLKKITRPESFSIIALRKVNTIIYFREK